MFKLADARMKGQAFARILGAVQIEAGPSSPGFSEYGASYADATDRLRIAFDMPRVSEPDELAFVGKVNQLLRDLHSDASSRLED